MIRHGARPLSTAATESVREYNSSHCGDDRRLEVRSSLVSYALSLHVLKVPPSITQSCRSRAAGLQALVDARNAGLID